MKCKAILLFMLITIVMTQEPDIPSSEVNDDEDLILLGNIDMWAFLIVCPICFVCILFITIMYICYPETRKMPNDIMLALSISDMCLLGQWFSTSLYSKLHERSISPTFCNIESIFGIVGSSGQFIYNCIFCVFLLIQIRVGIKGQGVGKLRSAIYHGVAIGCCIVITVVVYATGSQGQNNYGTCSFKSMNIFTYISIFLVFFYVILASCTLCNFKKQVPDDPAFRKYRDRFLSYYNMYVMWTCVIWVILTVSHVIVAIDQYLKFSKDTMNMFITVDNFAKLLAPVVLTIIRYLNPSIKPLVNRFFRKHLCCCFYEPTKAQSSTDLTLLSERSSSLSELQLNWFGQLTSSIKMSQLYTILVGLNRNFNKRINYEVTSINTVRNDSVGDIEKTVDIIEENSAESPTKVTVIPMRMVTHCPSIFQEFIDQDGFKLQDIRDSLDPVKSLSLINQSCADGGKSGQFFLFTSDYSLLVKTITEEELNVYLKRISKFAQYYRKAPLSLITKFYGVFSFQCLEFTAPKIHLLLTRNITRVGKTQLRAIYDLKGSRHNREVMKARKTMSFKVLKDIDFENIEGRMFAKKEQLNILRNSLTGDSLFLRDIGLMDYSLIIAKVDVEEGEEVMPYKGQCQSILEPEIWYRVGIIDYLQLWNSKKRLEKTAKQILNASLKLDTSAQDPLTYCNRFISLLDRILNEQNKRV